MKMIMKESSHCANLLPPFYGRKETERGLTALRKTQAIIWSLEQFVEYIEIQYYFFSQFLKLA